VIPSFNFCNAAARKWGQHPKHTINWLDDIPRSCISTDGIHGVAYFPNLIPMRSLVSIPLTLMFPIAECIMSQAETNKNLYEYAEIVAPHQGRTATNKTRGGKFRNDGHHISGEVRIVKGWNAIGHPVSDLFVYNILFVDSSRVLIKLYPLVNLLDQARNFRRPRKLFSSSNHYHIESILF
jgi:hypothetical protein